MRLFLISLFASAIISWFVVGRLITPSIDNHTGEVPSPERISLLGNPHLNQPEFEEIQLDDLTSVHEWLNSIDTATPEELKQWLVDLLGSPEDSEEVIRLIVANLASRDPKDTFEYLTSTPDLAYYYGTVLEEWARLDLSQAFAAYLTVAMNGPLLGDLTRALSGEEREEVYQMLIDGGFDQSSPFTFAEIFQVLAEADPEGAMDRLLEFKRSSGYGEEEAYRVMQVWHRQDSQAAFEWAMDLEDPAAKEVAISAYARVTVQKEGLAGIDRMWSLLNESQRRMLISFLPNLSDDIEGTMRWMDTNLQSPRDHQSFLQSLIRDTKDSDHPERLADILSHPEMALTDDEVLLDRVKEASKTWASKDVGSFQDWMKSLENPDMRRAAQEGLTDFQWEEAIDRWEKQGGDLPTSGEVNPSALTRMIEQANETGGNEAIKGMITRLPEAWREEALKTYASDFSEAAPEETLQFLTAQPKGTERDRGLQMAFGFLAEQDPRRAAELITELEAGEVQELALLNFANTWVRSNPAEAIEWLKKVPPSAERDEAVKQTVGIIARYHPSEALTLAQTLMDGKSTEVSMISAMNELLRRNPDLAAEHLENLKVSPDFESQARQRLKQERALRLVLESSDTR